MNIEGSENESEFECFIQCSNSRTSFNIPNRFSHFCRVHDCDRQTDRQTDRLTNHATRSVTIGCMYVCGTAMRPNNSANGTKNTTAITRNSRNCQQMQTYLKLFSTQSEISCCEINKSPLVSMRWSSTANRCLASCADNLENSSFKSWDPDNSRANTDYKRGFTTAGMFCILMQTEPKTTAWKRLRDMHVTLNSEVS